MTATGQGGGLCCCADGGLPLWTGIVYATRQLYSEYWTFRVGVSRAGRQPGDWDRQPICHPRLVVPTSATRLTSRAVFAEGHLMIRVVLPIETIAVSRRLLEPLIKLESRSMRAPSKMPSYHRYQHDGTTHEGSLRISGRLKGMRSDSAEERMDRFCRSCRPINHWPVARIRELEVRHAALRDPIACRWHGTLGRPVIKGWPNAQISLARRIADAEPPRVATE